MFFQHSLFIIFCLNFVINAVPATTDDNDKVHTASNSNIHESKASNNLPLTTNSQTPVTVASTAKGTVKESEVFASSTPYDYYGEDYDRPFFQCRELGTRCSYVQRCCGSLRCRREKFYYFFGRCY